jgi:hypothetical protein
MDTAGEMDTLESRLLELNLDLSASPHKQSRRVTIEQARSPSRHATETHTPNDREIDSIIENVESCHRDEPNIVVERDQTNKI